MIEITCDGCGEIHHAVRPLPLRCRCGHTTTITAAAGSQQAAPAAAAAAPPPPAIRRRRPTCIHRGEIIAHAECDCGAQPPVYACEIHGHAMDREYPHAPAGVLIRPGGKSRFVQPGSCDRCPDWSALSDPPA